MSAISRVSGVQRSGLKIVKKRRCKPANLATQKDYAAIDFKPWVLDDKKILPPDAMMKAITINSRLAYSVMLAFQGSSLSRCTRPSTLRQLTT